MITAYSAKPLARHIDTPEYVTTDTLKGNFVDMGKSPMRRVIAEVSLTTGVRVSDILGPRRDKPIVRARFMAMGICRKHCNASLPEIGRVFHRDHTSVLNAIRRVDELTTTKDRADMRKIAKRAGVVK